VHVPEAGFVGELFGGDVFLFKKSVDLAGTHPERHASMRHDHHCCKQEQEEPLQFPSDAEGHTIAG
jgi:hypothetical protein